MDIGIFGTIEDISDDTRNTLIFILVRVFPFIIYFLKNMYERGYFFYGDGVSF